MSAHDKEDSMTNEAHGYCVSDDELAAEFAALTDDERAELKRLDEIKAYRELHETADALGFDLPCSFREEGLLLEQAAYELGIELPKKEDN